MFLLWIGPNFASRVTTVAFSAVFPMALATLAGGEGIGGAMRFADLPGVFAGIIVIATGGFALIRAVEIARRTMLG